MRVQFLPIEYAENMLAGPLPIAPSTGLQGVIFDWSLACDVDFLRECKIKVPGRCRQIHAIDSDGKHKLRGGVSVHLHWKIEVGLLGQSVLPVYGLLLEGADDRAGEDDRADEYQDHRTETAS